MAASNGRKTSSSNKRTALSTTTKGTVKTRTSAQKKKEEAQQLARDSALFHEIGLIVLFAVMVLLFCCNFGIVGPVGNTVSGVLFGLFGLTAYAAPVLIFLAAAFWFANEGNASAARKLIAGILLFVIAGVVFDMLWMKKSADAEYNVVLLYEGCRDGKAGGGILGGSISFCLQHYLGTLGTVLVVLVVSVVCLILLTEKSILDSIKRGGSRVRELSREDARRRREEAERRREEMERRREEEAGYDEDDGQEDEGYEEDAGKRGGNGQRAESERRRENAERRRENIDRRRENMERRKEESRRRREEGRLRRQAQEEQRRIRAEEKENEKILRMERKVSGVMLDTALQRPEASSYRDEMHEIILEEETEELLPQDNAESVIQEGAETENVQYADSECGESVKTDTKRAENSETLPAQESGDAFDQWDMQDLPIRIHIEGQEQYPLGAAEMSGQEADSAGGAGGAEQAAARPAETEPFIEEGIIKGEGLSTEEGISREEAFSAAEGGSMEAGTFVGEGMSMEEGAFMTEGLPAEKMTADEMHSVSEAEVRSDSDGYSPSAVNRAASASIDTSETQAESVSPPMRSAAASASPSMRPAALASASVRPRPAAGNPSGRGAENQLRMEEGFGQEIADNDTILPKQYLFPPITLLQRGKAMTGDSVRELKNTAMHLQQTLSTFGVKVTITDISQGPSVTRYELQPEQGVKVSKIVGLADDIKLNLAAMDIRIEAPIPGKAAIGIEVPNKESMTVALRDLLETTEFKEFPSNLAFAVGKDIGGKVIVADIAKMPHMLIAGATGSGKSVCINTLIMSILYKAHPDDVKLIMVDPKVVELSIYNGIPHLLIPVVTDPKKASAALHWGVAEMEDRYRKFAECNVRDLKGYNKKVEAMREKGMEDAPKKLPQIVIIVDELADLMMVCPGEVEESICRLAQLARAAGIHLIIATQRPSVDVITGLIKANMPSRVAFSVSSGVDSRTILDMVGAEKLLGKGDMLFYPQGYAKPARVQGAFVSDNEVSDVVDFMKNQTLGNVYAAEIEEKIKNMGSSSGSGASGGSAVDDLFEKAGRLIIDKDKASIGMLQRALQIGFNRAARIMDQLSSYGVVGEEEGTKPRKILMSPEQFEQLLEEV